MIEQQKCWVVIFIVCDILLPILDDEEDDILFINYNHGFGTYIFIWKCQSQNEKKNVLFAKLLLQ